MSFLLRICYLRAEVVLHSSWRLPRLPGQAQASPHTKLSPTPSIIKNMLFVPKYIAARDFDPLILLHVWVSRCMQTYDSEQERSSARQGIFSVNTHAWLVAAFSYRKKSNVYRILYRAPLDNS